MHPPLVRPSSLPTAAVAVVRAKGELRLVATRRIAAGERILTIDGVVVDRASRHSVQVGPGAHVEAPPGAPAAEARGRYAWRYLNHACRPNAAVRDGALWALSEIVARSEITFDYNTTEFDMECPFRCRCGAPDCVGEVRGFSHLTDEQRARVAPHAAPHLLGSTAWNRGRD